MTIPAAASRLPAPLRALGHRNFRLYFFGQAVSILGSWIQQVALAWLVYRLTHSAALLGLAAFCALIPQLLVGPLAGAWIDKHDKRRWLIIVQSLLAAQALLLAGLTWAELVNGPLLLLMSAILGVLNSFDTPLRQSLIGSFVGRREHLPNALALNAMLFNAGRFVGPPVAGLLLHLMSEAACFAINALSFVALIAGLLLIRIEQAARAAGSVSDVFREGVRYAWDNWLVRTLIITLTAVNLTASAYAVLLPVFAREVFAGDAATLGWLWGAAGCGAFASTIFLTTRHTGPAVVGAVVVGAGISAIGLLAFSMTTYLPLALLAMAAIGFGISVSNVGINMLLQSTAPERLRGRVVSFFTSTRFGFDALGGLFAGMLASIAGAGNTMCAEGVLLLAFFLGYLLSKRTQLARATLPASS